MYSWAPVVTGGSAYNFFWWCIGGGVGGGFKFCFQWDLLKTIKKRCKAICIYSMKERILKANIVTFCRKIANWPPYTSFPKSNSGDFKTRIEYFHHHGSLTSQCWKSKITDWCQAFMDYLLLLRKEQQKT